MASVTGWVALAIALAVGGCADDSPSQDGDDTGTSTAADPTTAGPTTGDPDTGTAAVDTSTGGETLQVESAVVTFDRQPMVVDVTLTFSEPASAELVHPSDPGVLVERTQALETEATYRVRGLAPATLHALDYSATADAGAEATGQLEFTTPAPLPGFVQQFDVTGRSAADDPRYRLFDISQFPTFDPQGLFMVGSDGRTRWYLGASGELGDGPTAVWAAAKLLPDGSVMYVRNGALLIRDELGDTVLSLTAPALGLSGLHHEILELPGGNLMALSYTFRDIDYPGMGTLPVAGDLVVEFTRDGDIVWQWDTFDHLDPQRIRHGFFEFDVPNPVTLELARDWTHANGIEYDAETDTLLVSLRHQDWIVAVDHATGDLLWRLGEDGDFKAEDNALFYHQHSPQWQPDGSLLMYDNGNGNPHVADPEERSRVLRLDLDMQAMEASVAWQDDADPFMSSFAGDADRLPSGNYFVVDSAVFLDPMTVQALLRELDATASPSEVWRLEVPTGFFVYRGTAHDRLVGIVD